MYLWFFIIDTIICYKYTSNFKTFCFRQYWDCHISWFHTENDFIAKIGGHHAFWSPFWYICKYFLTRITVFVILRNIYLEINCVYLWQFIFLFFFCIFFGTTILKMRQKRERILKFSVSYYLGSKHSEKYMFIHINMVGVNDGPAYSFWHMPE